MSSPSSFLSSPSSSPSLSSPSLAASRLARLLRPRTLAAVGGKEAAQVVYQCLAMGYEGSIFPVHPTKKEVHGIRCYPSLEALPAAPDATFLGVNHRLTVKLARALRRMGAGGAVSYASGFSEAQGEIEDGSDLQQQLLDAAQGMPLLGPNCYGFVNCLDRVVIWPDQHAGEPCEKGVAILTQSSNIAMNMSMQKRAVPLAFFSSLGNQAQTGMLELAQALLEDERITAIGLVIEGITEIERLESLAVRARDLRKPLVALKVGRSEQARKAALSHTASLSGSFEATQAALLRLGIGQVQTLPVLMETLKLLHTHGALEDARLSSMSCSGGEAALIADQVHARRKARFPALSQQQQRSVKSTLSKMVTAANPLDYHTFIWAKRDALTKTFSAMLACPFDLHLLVCDFPHEERCSDTDWLPAAQALEKAVETTGARAAVVATLHENLQETWAKRFLEKGIAPLYGMQEALDAIETAADIGARWKAWRKEKKRPIFLNAKTTRTEQETTTTPKICLWDEFRAKNLLNEHGIRVPRGEIATSAAEACAFQQRVGGSVVLKVLGVAHKSEVDALALDLDSEPAITEAFRRLSLLSQKHGKEQEGLLVEQMVTGSLCELLLGITRDEQFGLMLTLAWGGRLVELMREKVVLPLPVLREEIEAALAELSVLRLLEGYRGGERGDVAALLTLCENLSQFAEKNAERILELDVNPVVVCSEKSGGGAVALDALLRTIET